MKFEEYINKVYNVAFRLTGDEKAAFEIASPAIESIVHNLDNNSSVSSNVFMMSAKEVCKAFIVKSQGFCSHEEGEKYTYSSKEHVNKAALLQKALLRLDPASRMTVVWRDILNFSLEDLTSVASCSKKELYCKLNDARRHLIKTINRIGEKNEKNIYS